MAHSISASCPACQKRFVVPASRAGQRAECTCGERFVVTDDGRLPSPARLEAPVPPPPRAPTPPAPSPPPIPSAPAPSGPDVPPPVPVAPPPDDHVAVACPACTKSYRVPRERVGQTAQCRCGTTFLARETPPAVASVVPGPAASPGTVSVACPACAITYAVPRERLGQIARCRCGTTFTAAERVEPATVSVSCPTCRKPYAIPRARLGHTARCGCGATFVAQDESSGGYAIEGGVPAPVPVAAAPIAPCPRHADVRATAACVACGAPMCATCRFQFDHGALCPDCATSPETVTSARRTQAICAIVFGAIALLSGVGIIVLGSMSTTAYTTTREEVVGSLLGLLGCGTALASTTLGLVAMLTRGPKSMLIWMGLVIGALPLLIGLGLVGVGVLMVGL